MSLRPPIRRLVATMTLAWSGAVTAQPAPSRGEPVRIQVVAMPGGEGCVDTDELAREVTRRLGRAPTAPDARSVDVVVRRDDPVWRATIYARERVGGAWQTGVREISPRGGTCPELSQAVTLAVTLTIDPDARIAPPTPATSGNPSLTSTPPTGAGPVGAGPVVTPPAGIPPVVTPPPVSPPPVSPPPVSPPSGTPPVTLPSTPLPVVPPRSERPAAWRYPTTLSLEGIAALGVAHDVSPGVALRVLLPTRGRWSGGVRAWWIPATATADGDAALGASLFAGGVCGRGEPGPFTVHGCGGAAAGITHAAALRYVPLDGGDRPWAGLWLGGGVGVVLHPRVSVSLGLDVLAPLYASAYRIQGRSDPRVWQPWTVQVIGAVGLDLRLP